MEVLDVECSLVKEFLLPSGEVGRRENHKTAKLSLCRAASSSIALRVIQSGNREVAHSLKPGRVELRRRFLKEGRATIVLPDDRLNLMLSNCPPGHLASFLRTLMIKLTAGQGTPKPQAQGRLLQSASSLENISPLTDVDVTRAQNVLDSRAASSSTPQRTGSLSRVDSKRKALTISPSGKENRKQSCLRATSGPPSKTFPSREVSRALIKRTLSLTDQQSWVLDLVRSGKSIFLTGGAGTGKSFLLRRIVSTLPPDATFVTASTGVAACHIGGTTLHSFAGVGTVPGTDEENVARASRPVPAAKWRRCSHLVIDEISMVDGQFFDALEYVARAVRGNEKPFGGIQLIVTGDFFQLPPVMSSSKKVQFCFEARAWRRCVHTNVELVDVHRQSDPEFISMLRELRLGRCTADTTQRLQATASHTVETNGVKATRLTTHRDAVRELNTSQLKGLPGKEKPFEASDCPPEAANRLNQLCPAPKQLLLKVGAQVMLTKNISMSEGLVNGARGIVTAFDPASGLPKVRFTGGTEHLIRQEKWIFGSSANMNIRYQLPLQLAWAISIHKSQGMSLDCVELSLGRVFESGQAYVALSRARSLESLRVIDFEPSCVRAHPSVVEFYKRARFETKRQGLQVIELPN